MDLHLDDSASGAIVTTPTSHDDNVVVNGRLARGTADLRQTTHSSHLRSWRRSTEATKGDGGHALPCQPLLCGSSCDMARALYCEVAWTTARGAALQGSP